MPDISALTEAIIATISLEQRDGVVSLDMDRAAIGDLLQGAFGAVQAEAQTLPAATQEVICPRCKNRLLMSELKQHAQTHYNNPAPRAQELPQAVKRATKKAKVKP